MAYCEYCDRDFAHEAALEQHLRDSSKHIYCSRCAREFRSQSAKQQHLDDSSSHNICIFCEDFDFESQDDLIEHVEDDHYGCLAYEISLDTASELEEHNVSEHNMCESCERYFSTHNELAMHEKTHNPCNVECPGCESMYKSESAMVLHLEADTCDSGWDCEDVREIAFECHLSYAYTNDDDYDYDYKCPNCDMDFTYISGLLQHAESDACDADVKTGALGKFLRFLRSRF